MSRSKLKKKTDGRRPKKATASPPLDPLQTGMPALDSIIGVTESKKGKRVFRVIHTDEVDEYERAPKKTKREMR
jgi:hypothetical protein